MKDLSGWIFRLYHRGFRCWGGHIWKVGLGCPPLVPTTFYPLARCKSDESISWHGILPTLLTPRHQWTLAHDPESPFTLALIPARCQTNLYKSGRKTFSRSFTQFSAPYLSSWACIRGPEICYGFPSPAHLSGSHFLTTPIDLKRTPFESLPESTWHETDPVRFDRIRNHGLRERAFFD